MRQNSSQEQVENQSYDYTLSTAATLTPPCPLSSSLLRAKLTTQCEVTPVHEVIVVTLL